MTLSIKDFLNSPDDGLFISLLNEWGAWCHGGLPRSLRRSQYQSYSITDDDGIAVDQALAQLKSQSIFHYECIRCEYIFHLGIRATKMHLIELLNKIGDPERAQLLKRNFNRLLFEQALASAEKRLIELIKESHSTNNQIQSLGKSK